MRIILTGATGFVGRGLTPLLLQQGHEVTAAVRKITTDLDSRATQVLTNDLSAQQNWQPIVSGHEAVIHLAARVHVMSDDSSDPLAEYRKTNVEGTLNFARQAAEAGVKRFLFISSVKVNGEGTTPGNPYRAESQPKPLDPYGISKLEAEQGLLALSAQTGMEVVIIRPVLVYGPGVQANFLNMMRWLYKGVPLPFGAINNRRSLVALDNLTHLIAICIVHPAAANQTFMVSDGEDLSTTMLLRRMGIALGKPARMLPVPAWILETSASILGKQALAQRLCGSLQVDIEKTRALLDWTPPVSVDEALRKTAKHFLDRQTQ
jgi:UDP-glucose 4-epimerase